MSWSRAAGSRRRLDSLEARSPRGLVTPRLAAQRVERVAGDVQCGARSGARVAAIWPLGEQDPGPRERPEPEIGAERLGETGVGVLVAFGECRPGVAQAQLDPDRGVVAGRRPPPAPRGPGPARPGRCAARPRRGLRCASRPSLHDERDRWDRRGVRRARKRRRAGRPRARQDLPELRHADDELRPRRQCDPLGSRRCLMGRRFVTAHARRGHPRAHRPSCTLVPRPLPCRLEGC